MPEHDTTTAPSQEWTDSERARIQAEADAHEAAIVPGTREWIRWERRRLAEEAREFDRSKGRLGTTAKADYYQDRDARRQAATDAEKAIYAQEDAEALERAGPAIEEYQAAIREDSTEYGRGRVAMMVRNPGAGSTIQPCGCAGGRGLRQDHAQGARADAFWTLTRMVEPMDHDGAPPMIYSRADLHPLLYGQQVNILFGKPGQGKSFITLDIMVQCMRGWRPRGLLRH